MHTLLFNGKTYDCRHSETVLNALLRQHVPVPYSCKKQICMSCMMQALNGTPPREAQINLKETLRLQNNFLACACVPEGDMEIALIEERLTTQVNALVTEINPLNSWVLELVLMCDTPVNYYGGQSALLLNHELIGKKFPIASATSAKTSGKLEVHAERGDGRPFSEWLFNRLKVGDKLIVSGVSGDTFFVPGSPSQAILMVGWDLGLSPLIGMIQDIFELDHSGPVYLLHCAQSKAHLYYEKALLEIEDYFPNFRYRPCIQQGFAPANGFSGDICQLLAAEMPELTDWKVYLCGRSSQIQPVQRQVYLAGSRMKDIFLEVTAI